MKAYVVLKTYITDIADIFPNVLRIADTMEEALDAIYQNVENYTMEEIEQEFDDNNCFESGKARYTIFKYVD